MNESESQVRLRCQLLHLQCGSVSWLGLGLVRMRQAGRRAHFMVVVVVGSWCMCTELGVGLAPLGLRWADGLTGGAG